MPHSTETHAYTVIGENGVNYAVERYRPDLMVCEELWSRTVLFSLNGANRAGGLALFDAAREQKHQLELAGGHLGYFVPYQKEELATTQIKKRQQIESIKLIAIEGAVQDWALYWGPADWPDEKVIAEGVKLPEDVAKRLAERVVIDPIWAQLKYRS